MYKIRKAACSALVFCSAGFTLASCSALAFKSFLAYQPASISSPASCPQAWLSIRPFVPPPLHLPPWLKRLLFRASGSHFFEGELEYLTEELVTNPCFIVDGVSRFDYKQGHLGNCWFLASVGGLTFQKDITNQVIPVEQSFSKNYVGIFQFKFWRFGEWIDVVIDDLLPTFNEKLVFVHPKTSNEFWPALLEKAYAKVCGSYADLDSGRRSEAMLDFTGGVHLHFALNEAPAYLWNIMERATRAQSLICSGTYNGEPHAILPPSGIVSGHAYTVTGVSKVISNRNPVKLVRLLNPWGRKEWTGDWSDKSPLWNTVSGKDNKKCHEDLDNGEFWMSVKDFNKFFKSLDICCLSPDFLDRSSGFNWKSQRSIGEWTESTAGGSMKDLDTFWKNPQFRLMIEELNEACPHKDAENTVVSLIQNHKKRHRKDQKHYNIGFYVFE
ncbi:hypothetical protein QQF64_011384, partial [Cirrhinus molitorella]